MWPKSHHYDAVRGRKGRPPAVAPITSQADSATAKLKSETRPGLLAASLKQRNYERSWSAEKSATPLRNQLGKHCHNS